LLFLLVVSSLPFSGPVGFFVVLPRPLSRPLFAVVYVAVRSKKKSAPKKTLKKKNANGRSAAELVEHRQNIGRNRQNSLKHGRISADKWQTF